MRYHYASEKFHAARQALMLPHTQGESIAIMHAFMECSLGLHKLDIADTGSSATGWVRKLQAYMDTTGIVADPERGAWATKADSFTVDDKIEISRLIDELASWFDDQTR